MILAALLLLATALQTQAQSDLLDPLNDTIASDAAQFRTTAYTEYPQLAAQFVDLQRALNSTINTIAQLYDPSERSLVTDGLWLGNDCPVANHLSYMMNSSKLHETLCCHVQHLRFPAIINALKVAQTYFLGVNFGTVQTTQFLRQMAELEQITVPCATYSECLLDRRIIDWECAVRPIRPASEFVEDMIDAHTHIAYDAYSLQGCLGVPTLDSGCANNNYLTVAIAPPLVNFTNYDKAFLQICGAKTLVNLQLNITNARC